ncbi:flagellin [Parvularcula sp. LCG005]|uniref:flagellin n=1 Tax=Parvularcula sp. LCG005 TaxID=3078805 RepID=UPI002942DE77|nr:flagellin [Parvularcula sp. LCG005]WOI52682.1 flagellin [Parvularcula sp. LCG005]
MTSINTNPAAMVALETLRGINKSLNTLNDQISTGKVINTAKDNSALWSISKTMGADLASFKTVSESLGLASATVGVGRNAAERITDLLVEIKAKVTQAQDKTEADRTKIQADITALRSQITDIVDSAQVNGVNIINNTNNVSYLSSFNRASDGSVATGSITVTGVDLSVGTADNAIVDGVLGTGVTIAGFADTGAINTTAGTTQSTLATLTASTVVTEGDNYELNVGVGTVDYQATATDTAEDILRELGLLVDGLAGLSGSTVVLNGSNYELRTDIAVGTNSNSIDTVVRSAEATSTGGTAGGSLDALRNLSVINTGDAASALSTIEDLITAATDAAASFGSAQKRVELQTDWVMSLIDSLELGNSALIDADITAASAKLQALQVQQQLGIQSLSIANNAPTSILALFQ